jgi:hypothetical protein
MTVINHLTADADGPAPETHWTHLESGRIDREHGVASYRSSTIDSGMLPIIIFCIFVISVFRV